MKQSARGRKYKGKILFLLLFIIMLCVIAGPCEKISVNSTTVIKNDIASGLKNSRSIFLQYTIHTVICQVSPTVSLLKWSVAEWKQTDCAGSAQPVGVHDLQLAKNSAPVSQRHRPLLCNLVGCQIQSL